MGVGGAMRLLVLVLLAADFSELKMSKQQRESVIQQAHFKLLRRHLDAPSHQLFGSSSVPGMKVEAPEPLPPGPAWMAAQLLMIEEDEEDETGEAEKTDHEVWYTEKTRQREQGEEKEIVETRDVGECDPVERTLWQTN